MRRNKLEKNKKFTEWLVKQAKYRGYSEIEIDCEYNMIYFKDSYQGKAAFSPLKKMDAYFVREKTKILEGCFTRKDTVYRVHRDGTMSLIQTEFMKIGSIGYFWKIQNLIIYYNIEKEKTEKQKKI